MPGAVGDAIAHQPHRRCYWIDPLLLGNVLLENIRLDGAGQFIEVAKKGGMAAVCETDDWRERIKENPENYEKLMTMDAAEFIATLSSWKELFEKGAHYSVMGITDEQLKSLTMPTIVIPGNDNTHSSASGHKAHELIPGSKLHDLGLKDEDVDLIPYPDWSPYEAEISTVLTEFMHQH